MIAAPTMACGRKEGQQGGGTIQLGGLKPERIHPRDAVCGPRITESDARFGGAVVTPIWGSCGMALSATAGAPAGRSGASGRECLHRAPVQLAGAGAAWKSRRAEPPPEPYAQRWTRAQVDRRSGLI